MIQGKEKIFDIALIEVGSGKDKNGDLSGINLVEACKRTLPLIATTWTDKTDVMYKAISAGAVDVLSKPISLQKLRNIFQHLVRKEYRVSNVKSNSDEARPSITEALSRGQTINMQRQATAKMPAPVGGERSAPSKVYRPGGNVGTFNQQIRKINNFQGSNNNNLKSSLVDTKTNLKKELAKTHSSSSIRSASNLSVLPTGTSKSGGMNVSALKSEHMKSDIISCDKRKKVDWSPDLHRRFVKAVEQLGIDNAIPSRILELMGVKTLTRHHIASHLQKYRKHRRNLASRGQDISTSVAVQWPPGRMNRQGNEDSKPTEPVRNDSGVSQSQSAPKRDSAVDTVKKPVKKKVPVPVKVSAKVNSGGKFDVKPSLDASKKEKKPVNTSQPSLQRSNVTTQSVPLGVNMPGLQGMGQPPPPNDSQFDFKFNSYPYTPTIRNAYISEGQMGTSDFGYNSQSPFWRNDNQPGREQSYFSSGRNTFGQMYSTPMFDPISAMRTDYYPQNDILEATIKDVLNSNELDSFPIGLKPPVMDSILEEAEQRGFHLDFPNLNQSPK